MTYSRLPSGPSPMTTRLSARRSTGEATPPPQQTAADDQDNFHVDEDEVTKARKFAALKLTDQMIDKVALENGYTLTISQRGGSAPPSTPKSSPTKISIKRPSSSTNGITQHGDSMTKASSSPEAAAAPSTTTPSSSPSKIKRIRIKMPTPPGNDDDDDQEIKSSRPPTPVTLSFSQLSQSPIKPASSTNDDVKGEDDTGLFKQPKELPEALNTPPKTHSVSPADAQLNTPGSKRKRETEVESTPAEPPKKRGRKPKAAVVAEAHEQLSQEAMQTTPVQTQAIEAAEEPVHLSPDPTGKRKRLAKKLIGAVNLEADLASTVSPRQPSTLERQIASAIIKGMSSQSLSSGRETRQSTARASAGRAEARPRPEESSRVAEEPATPTPNSRRAPKPSEKVLGKHKAEEPPAEAAKPPKKRGRPPKKTAGTLNVKRAENQQDDIGIPAAASSEPVSHVGRPKRGSRAARATEAQAQPISSEKPPQTPEPEPTLVQGRSVNKPNGVFRESNQYAETWEDSSFAGVVDPATVNDPSFGTFTSPTPHKVCPPSSAKQAKDLRWDIATAPDHPAWATCNCDLCIKTMHNARSLRAGKWYFFSYATNVFPSHATEETGAVPIAFGKIRDHRFLICGNALLPPSNRDDATSSTSCPTMKTAAPAPAPASAPASGLPTIAPSPGDEVFGLLYECPDRASVAKMAVLAGRGDYDYRTAKARIELTAHAAKRRPETAGREQPLRTVARVDAVVVRADPGKYHMPPQPAEAAVAPPPPPKKEDNEDGEPGDGGRPRRRVGRPRRQPPAQKQKQQQQQQHEEEEEEEQRQETAAAPLKEGYVEAMNGAVAEAVLYGGGFPRSYVRDVVRKWIPAPQERI